MRPNLKRKAIILMILVTIFAFPLLINANLNYFGYYNYETLEVDTESRLKRAGFWDLTGSPIFIDDSDPNYNWSKTAADNVWCSGSGIWNDPYIIENVTINGVYNVSCIYVKNSNVYFKIKNCTLINIEKDPNYWLAAHSGIRFEYVNNGMLIDNTCSFNDGRGFFLVHCDNLTISGNTANYNTRQGMLLQHNDDNNINNNSVRFNGWDAIFIYNSFYNNFSGNNAWTSQHGITVQFSNYNDISDNIFNNNDGYGIYLMSGSQYNDISGNIVIEHTSIGIYIGAITDQNNLFFDNYMKNNGLNAEDNGQFNDWDNGSLGNYWSDYDGIDANDDGIGDTPYNISGSAGSLDNFPVWRDLTFSIVSPAPNDKFSKNTPNFVISIEEGFVNSTWYTLDYGVTNKTFTGLTGAIDQVLWGATSDGSVTIRFYANDTMGHITFEEVTINKDATAPNITINSPSTSEIFGINAPDYILTIVEPNMHTMWYTLDGGVTNMTFTGLTGAIDQVLWGATSDGSVTIRFYANDTTGNIAFEEIEVIKRTTEDVGIPGFNLFFLLGTLSVTAILISKKLKKS